VIFDVLWRWLERSGYDVVFARNVTDVDDKIIARSAEEGVSWWQFSQLVIHQMERAYDLLGLRPPTVDVSHLRARHADDRADPSG
jgi:cysteinyl-tRNA synthetase